MSRHQGEKRSFPGIIEPGVLVLHVFIFRVKLLPGKKIGTMKAMTPLEFSCIRFSDCVQ